MHNTNEESIRKFEKFFISDLKIKNLLSRIAPDEMYNYNQDSRVEYGEKIYRGLNDIEYEFSKILNDFNFDEEILTHFKDKINLCRQELLNCNYNFHKMQSIYQKYLSSMNKDLISKVHDVCFGNNPKYDINNLFNKCISINEMLHVTHSYITNNDKLWKSIPQISTKFATNGKTINLYGKENPLSKNIFDSFPIDSNCGVTDIISFDKNNKILMMVKDKGHALSIEIDIEDDKVWVKYFIPKVTNIDIVNKLNGINKTTKQLSATTGLFVTTKEELSTQIIDLVDKIPTDAEMDISHFDRNFSSNENGETDKYFGISNIESLAKTRTISGINSIYSKIKSIFKKNEKGILKYADDEHSKY